MTFLSEVCSKSLLTLQLNHVQYQNQILTFRITTTTREMSALQTQYSLADDDTLDIEKDPYYQYLQQQSENYELQKEDLENQISLLESAASSFDTLIKNGIKNSCGLTLSGGS